MKFTKYNNPNKRRRRKPANYTDKCITETKGMMSDKRLGYVIPVETYERKCK